MTSSARAYELKALTDIWTGDATTAQSKKANRLIPTGLLGSIRWWFEVLVRGFGGAPCDPSANQKACFDDKHCVVCELFGCTGWARKVRFEVRNVQDAVIQSKLLKGTTFRLRFTPLRAVHADEWALLDLTFRLISEFGALGGKTVLKPSEQNHKAQHADFGLVQWTGSTSPTSREQLAKYVTTCSKRPAVNGVAWASCSHMWFVDGKHLMRQDENTSTFNRALGRPELKAIAAQGDSWRAGSQGVSKKVFSFRSPPRTFGFVQQTSDFNAMRNTLRGIWNLPASSDDWFVSGETLLARLCGTAEAKP